MKLTQSRAPYISHPDSTRTFMINVILALLILYAMSVYYYGLRPLLLGLTSVVSAYITEWICTIMYKKNFTIHDLSAVVTGLLIPLMLPASVPFQVVAIAGVFAIFVAKMPFGGTGNNIFNPAAAGYAFVITSFSRDILFKYPIPLDAVPFFPKEPIELANSAAFSLGIGGIPSTDLVSMSLGNVPGPMGATNSLVLIACLLFLISRRTVRWQIPVSFLATTGLIAFIFRRIPVGGLQSVGYELASGLILFGAVFMLGDPVTTPKRGWAKTAYAAVCGAIVMIFRHVGNLEEGFIFAILFMNAFVWVFDMAFELLSQRLRRRRYETFANATPQKKA